jgi:hypothetical protein
MEIGEGQKIKDAFAFLREEGFKNELYYQITGSDIVWDKDPEKATEIQAKINTAVQNAISQGEYTGTDGIKHKVFTDPETKDQMALNRFARLIGKKPPSVTSG